jgi:hypothetical protein
MRPLRRSGCPARCRGVAPTACLATAPRKPELLFAPSRFATACEPPLSAQVVCINGHTAAAAAARPAGAARSPAISAPRVPPATSHHVRQANAVPPAVPTSHLYAFPPRTSFIDHYDSRPGPCVVAIQLGGMWLVAGMAEVPSALGRGGLAGCGGGREPGAVVNSRVRASRGAAFMSAAVDYPGGEEYRRASTVRGTATPAEPRPARCRLRVARSSPIADAAGNLNHGRCAIARIGRR